MTKRIFLVCISLVVVFVTAMAQKKFTLVIDAGHGGHDIGAPGAFSREKDINLSVALVFGRYVEKNCPDVKVIYTRKTDVFIPLDERANIANRNKADLFISIHTNALAGGKQARGLETYTLGMHRAASNLEVAKRENSVILLEKDNKQHYQGFDPKSSESYIMFEFMQDKNMAKSVDLAKMVQKEACSAAGRHDMGVYQAGFLVLRQTSMPSCLIELGFITTPDEEEYLNSPNGQDNLGRGIYNAFVRYKKKYHSNTPAAPIMASAQPKVEEKPQAQSQTQSTPQTPSQPQPKVEEKPKPQAQQPKPQSKVEEKPKPQAQQPKPQPKVEEKPKPQAQQPKSQPKVEEKPKPSAAPSSSAPVYKVQILSSGRALRTNSSQFKGHSDVSMYQEGDVNKYTIGETTDYNEIQRIRKKLLSDFPEAFIVAFKDGKKISVQEALAGSKKK